MQNVAQAMMQNMSNQRKQPSEPMKDGPVPDVIGPPAPVNPRREMRGPSIQAPSMPMMGGAGGGLGDMMQQLGPLGGMMQDMLGNMGGQQPMNSMMQGGMNMQGGPPMPEMSSQFGGDNESDAGFSEITSVSSIDFGNPAKTKSVLISDPKSNKKRGRKGKNEVTLNI